MTKQTQTNKEWNSIDFTKTNAYKTIKAYNNEGVFSEQKLPTREFGQLQRLRRIDSIVKPEKKIERVITTITCQIVRQKDKQGKTVSKEYLTIGGEFRGFDWSDEEYAISWEEGTFKKPRMVKVYKSRDKLDPVTGEDLGQYQPSGYTIEYTVQLTNDAAKRKKLNDDLIANSQAYPEDILYYFKDTTSGSRDNTFSYEQFVESSIDELRNLSKKGAGSKGPGFYRDIDNKLRDKDGNLVQN